MGMEFLERNAQMIIQLIVMGMVTASLGIFLGFRMAVQCYRRNPAVEIRGERRVVDMEYGETGWVVPWAISIRGGRPVIDGHCTVGDSRFGTSRVCIERTLGGVEIVAGHEGEEFSRTETASKCELPVRNGECVGARPRADAHAKPAATEDDLP